WTSSGTGSFTPDATSLSPTYTPSAADAALGLVTLTLTTTFNGNCQPVKDAMDITIAPIPIVNAGADTSMCGDKALLPLKGMVTHASGGTWTAAGSGSFSP